MRKSLKCLLLSRQTAAEWSSHVRELTILISLRQITCTEIIGTLTSLTSPFGSQKSLLSFFSEPGWFAESFWSPFLSWSNLSKSEHWWHLLTAPVNPKNVYEAHCCTAKTWAPVSSFGAPISPLKERLAFLSPRGSYFFFLPIFSVNLSALKGSS